MQESDELLRRLSDAGVAFVVVGGVAAIAHGAQRMTQDLDIVAPFNSDNMQRLLAAVRDVHPRNATRPDLGEIMATPEELAQYRNLYLVTDIGRLDVLGELPPVGHYPQAAANALQVDLFGHRYAILGLDDLIRIKRSIGRPKDQEVAAELEAIRERLARPL